MWKLIRLPYTDICDDDPSAFAKNNQKSKKTESAHLFSIEVPSELLSIEIHSVMIRTPDLVCPIVPYHYGPAVMLFTGGMDGVVKTTVTSIGWGQINFSTVM